MGAAQILNQAESETERQIARPDQSLKQYRRERLADDVLTTGMDAHERDRHRLGADALARDAAGGVGALVTADRVFTVRSSRLC
jgi:hypothetical protein